ncbi:MAG TPA: PQQ-binding-like beta-propeller repeat protein [Blastocatellia bacterium]|nr:PQQ-binding-like beta-propeller repeat protein [Blastocatellia bacterium]
MRKTSPILAPSCIVAFAATLFVALAICVSQSPTAQAGKGKPVSQHKPSPEAPRQVQIDLDKAVRVALPNADANLKPLAFRSSDGKKGWVIHIPGDRPISTPAYANGMLYVSGGYGSHEFYAFNAETGARVWQIKTSDDGPTAAVVEDGYVAFNTESCTVIVCDAKTGKLVWQEWLGDPLMSQPAIYKGRLYIAYPAGQRRHKSNASHGRGGSHSLLCADLKTGKHVWDQPITGDVISAPVISGNQVYLTCFEGTSFCLDAFKGSVVWKKQNAGTSAPLVAGGQVVLTQKEKRDGKAYEGMKRLHARGGEEKDRKLLAESEAQYLEKNKGGGVAITKSQSAALDGAVGFGGGAPPAAKLEAANDHLGVDTVAGGWAYQGSRAAYSKGQMMNAQGRYLNCMSAIDGRFAWRAEVKGAGISDDSQVFSPPALGHSNLYLCSAQGHLISVSQQSGDLNFIYSLNQPMAFQPMLAQGNVYVGTVNGLLICFKTGDKDADGWYAWGGNAQHNKNE